MKLVSSCLLLVVLLVPATIGCGGKSETGVVADQNELSAYVSQHPSEEQNVETEE